MQKEVGSMMVTGVVSSRMVMTEIAEEKWKMCKFHTFYFFFFQRCTGTSMAL